ncbi:MAG: dTDP-glucose 4,6-dehydratase [Candidatus Omnitrophota bacterium]
MRAKLSKILVTGGAGFIGSEFIRQIINGGGSGKEALLKYRVIVVDKLTYAADLDRLNEVEDKFRFYKADICHRDKIAAILKKEKPEVIVNFAAESHVDRSIIDSDSFIETNIKGVKTLLDLSREFAVERFIHISTDEIYGEIKKGKFCENSPLHPNNPYAVSKAAADLLIKAYIRIYKFPAIIIRPSNNYGPWQYPEKLIPLATLLALGNRKVPLYAKGNNIREWLYVADCVQAILGILKKGKIGEVYNVGSGQERRNIEVVRTILAMLGKPKSLIKFVKDRPGHDLRYSLNSAKIKKRLGWKAKTEFSQGIKYTIGWAIDNRSWIDKHKKKKLSIKF